MKKTLHVLMAAWLAFSWSDIAFAQTVPDAPPGVVDEVNNPPKPVTTPPAVTIVPSTNQASNKGKGSNNSASGIAQSIGSGLLSAGTAMMPPCAAAKCSCCPIALMMIMMGMQGLSQSKANKSTGKQHGGIATQSAASNGDQDYDLGSDLSTVFDAPAEDALAKAGIKKNGSTFTLPNGKTLSMKDIGDSTAMANAGISDGDWKKIQSLASEIEKKALTKDKNAALTPTNGFTEGGGGGAVATAAPAETEYMGGPGKEREPAASVAGMVKNYNGEMIGVANDNIFEMMARRYRQKSKEDGFLLPEAAPGSN